MDEETLMSSNTVALNASGMGIYSLGASSIAISGVDEYVKILVFADHTRAQLIAKLIVRPVLIEF